VLLEDLPGLGKTLAARSFAQTLGLEFTRAQFTPDLLPADLTGSFVFDQRTTEFSFRRGPLFTGLLLADEINRTPPKTQSALLSLMAEGYAEMYDQYVYAGRSSWFLTANDDAGGGTFQVIEALKDRIDVVVRAVPFNSSFIRTLLERLEAVEGDLRHAAQHVHREHAVGVAKRERHVAQGEAHEALVDVLPIERAEVGAHQSLPRGAERCGKFTAQLRFGQHLGRARELEQPLHHQRGLHLGPRRHRAHFADGAGVEWLANHKPRVYSSVGELRVARVRPLPDSRGALRPRSHRRAAPRL
jgi:hypothetical protein